MLQRNFRLALHIFLICCLAIIPTRLHAQEPDSVAGDRDYILILNAYTDSAPWSRSIISDIATRIERIEDLEVFTEHLGLMIVNDSKALDDVKAGLAATYPSHPPKILIFVGTPTLLFRDEVRRLWGDVPIILCAEEDYFGPDEAYLTNKPIPEQEQHPIHNLSQTHNLTLLHAPVYLQESIDLLKLMIPGLEQVILIGDGRYVNQQMNVDMEVLMSNYPDLQYTFYSAGNMSVDVLFDRLNQVDPKTTGVLFSSWYYKKRIGQNTTLITTTDKVMTSTPVPVFGLTPTSIKENGMVGGYVYNADNFSQKLLQTLDAVLAGKDPRRIPFYTPNDAIPIFNYLVIKRKGLSPDLSPANSLFLNKPTSFVERNKWLLMAGGGLLVLLLSFQQWRISVIRRIEKARRQEAESHNKYSALFNNMPILYLQMEAIRDRDGVVVDAVYKDVNTCFERNVLPKSQIIGRRGADFSLGTNDDFVHFLNIALREGRTISFPTYNSKLDIFYDVIMCRSYLPEHIDIFCLDATVRHRTQQQLSAANHKLSMALEVANIVPWKWNLHEHSIQCDMTHTEGLDTSGTQLTVPEQQYFATIHKQDRERVHAAYSALIEGLSSKVQEEYRILWSENGKRRIEWVEVKAAVDSRDKSGKPLALVGSSLVITPRKELEAELLSARDRAEQSNRLKSAFLANMSHEIRTPLNAIVGFSAMLASSDDHELKQDYLAIIENNNTLLLQLISDILDLSKIEAGTLEFEYSDFELNDLLHEKENVMRMRLKSDKVKLVVEAGAPGCFIRSERNRLSQLLINLLTNAIKFTEKGSIHFGYELRGEHIYFFVTDTGCGIPAQMCAQIFERFVKVDSFKQGTGLGLSICQTIVEKMGGEIGVESEEGNGSTFWFTLPFTVGRIPDLAEEVEVREYEPFDPGTEKPTLLIAEDNEGNYCLFDSVLEENFQLFHAWNGRDAVELFREHRPQVVLMDLNMPEMNGYEAAAAILEIAPQVPIIAVTAYAYASDEERVMASGFAGYIPKPINPKLLGRQIFEILRKCKWNV